MTTFRQSKMILTFQAFREYTMNLDKESKFLEINNQVKAKLEP